MDKEAEVQVSMSIAHAHALSKIVDLGVRIHLGQFNEIESLARARILQGRNIVTADITPLNMETLEELEALLNQIKSLFGHHQNGSFGIGSDGVNKDAKHAYEAKKAIDRALHLHERPDDHFSVTRDGVTVRYTDGKAPKAAVVES